MGRGKIEIKVIQNTTNRQVTYSKRKGGLFKKARELTVLCDAQVCLLMISSTNKFCDYCSPATDTKAIFDRHRRATGVDVWEEQYDRMHKQLGQVKAINNKLRTEIRQMMGEELEDLDMQHLRDLEKDITDSLNMIRARKENKITSQTETLKKKVKSLEVEHRMLLHQLMQHEIDARIDYAYMETGANGDDDDSAMRMGNVGRAPQHMNEFQIGRDQLNLGSMGYGLEELCLD